MTNQLKFLLQKIMEFLLQMKVLLPIEISNKKKINKTSNSGFSSDSDWEDSGDDEIEIFDDEIKKLKN